MDPWLVALLGEVLDPLEGRAVLGEGLEALQSDPYFQFSVLTVGD